MLILRVVANIDKVCFETSDEQGEEFSIFIAMFLKLLDKNMLELIQVLD